jgi:parvulin-like peptidyl-prolyl isomerase
MEHAASIMGPRAASAELDASVGLWSLLLALLLLVGCDGPRDVAVATMNGEAVLRSEVGIELRGTLWRRGEAWKDLDAATKQTRRKEALDRRIEQRLLQQWAPAPASPSAAQAQASEDAFQQFLKQFEPPEGWKPRLGMQGVSEMQMRERITNEVCQEGAMEAWLKTQRTQNPERAESAARPWFDQHRDQFRVPERARVSHIFLTGNDKERPDRSEEIAELYRKLSTGQDTLESLATKFSEDERSNKAGGSLGWIGRDRLPEDFAEQVFELPLGKASEPFRTKLGWHIVLVQERRPARLLQFPEVKDEIIARLDQAWRQSAVKQLMEELRGKAKIVVDEARLHATEPAAEP